MNRLHIDGAPAHTDIEWTPFPGGELEGQRPRALCPACRSKRAGAEQAAAGKQALCFQCYRLELERNRRIKAAGELDTASEARFQGSLPFEPVDSARLARLKVERQEERVQARVSGGDFVERRRRAQTAARHALARIVKGLKQRDLQSTDAGVRRLALENLTHAAELQLPDSWLPFVVAR